MYRQLTNKLLPLYDKHTYLMITKEFLNPQSIAIIGGSEDIQKPGGKVLKNLLDTKYSGNLYVVNPRANTVQGVPCYHK